MTDSQLVKAKVRKRTPRRLAPRRGVSLIEVLVVLVLLVTGILVIIRLYPSGFFSIQSTGNAGLADGLGTAAVGAQAQDADSLPEAILPVDPTNPNYNLLTTPTAALASYDPDDPTTLDNARIVSNETITVPALKSVTVAGVSARESIYAVKYGPIVLPQDASTTNAALLADFPSNLSINSTDWTPVLGEYTTTLTASSDNLPQATVFPGQERFLVDLVNQKIAVPYAVSYGQKMVVVITDINNKTFYQYLNIPQSTPVSATYPNAPLDNTGAADVPRYIADTTTNYQGGWFNPTDTTPVDYGDTTKPKPHDPPKDAAGNPTAWKSVTIYRPYQAILTSATPTFTADPYQFVLTSGNIGGTYPGANPGAIQFNSLAAGGTGASARKAKITYMTYSWTILREDHDIPALSGTSTTIVRTTVQNLRQAGAANPDNSIYSGLAASGKSLLILDLDTGLPVGSTNTPDPTDPDFPIVDEDTNGTNPNSSMINVSFATGRFTFGSNAFGDNPNGTTPHAHRVRIFYESELNWTVAVQKAPASYTRIADVVGGTDPQIGAAQCAFDPTGKKVLYFPRSDYGKTVEIDNITAYGANGAAIPANPPSLIVAVGKDTGDTLDTLGGTQYWSSTAISNALPALSPTGPGGAYATFTVRGLSSRAVVAWKERNQWKVHTVDTVLNRTQ